MTENQYIFFICGKNNTVQSGTLSAEFQVDFWEPSFISLRPASFPLIPFFIWSLLFHYCRIFRNRNYQIIVIRRGGKIVHRSCIFPGYFRFPFMKGQDLQVGDTWTAPTERGKGLARWALEKAINRFSTEDNNIWYVCEETNLASIKVAHSAKMHLVGRGCRSTKFGLSIFGQFLINEKFFKQ